MMKERLKKSFREGERALFSIQSEASLLGLKYSFMVTMMEMMNLYPSGFLNILKKG